ncbi:HAMP domain-containing histidine kinase [bacterium]|nr:HAMP domain-containing histidine kinase [bacterium]MBU1957884.1 HAMP domain-containing histidine kinase [bacterium]
MKNFIFIFLIFTGLFSNEFDTQLNKIQTHTIEIQENKDHAILQQLSITFSIILLGIFLWILQLKKHNKKLQKIKNELRNLNQTLEERVQIEVEKNKKHQLIMLHQSRLARMGQTINMIAHQWRQPLNNLALINQVLVLRYNKYGLDDNAINEFKHDSTIQIEEMSNTINDFKDFFKPDREKVEFDPKAVIKHSIRLMKPSLISKHIQIFIEYRDTVKLIGYPNEFGQSIMNILSNAKDALVENNHDKKREIYLNLYTEHDQAVITITDNAGGIASEVINNIFDPYFSTKTTKAGTGLGLYMSKMIIEEHMHGQLSVSNNKNGTCFTIRLKIG